MPYNKNQVPEMDTGFSPKNDDVKDFRQKKFGSIILSILIFSLIGFLSWGMSKNLKGRLHEGPAPEFSLTSFEGKTIHLSDFQGRVIVINFWASWCPPCREEAPYLEETWRKYKDKGVVFIGVDYVDVEPEALACIEEFNITYINGPDLRTAISQAYNIQGVPETFFIKKNGYLPFSCVNIR